VRLSSRLVTSIFSSIRSAFRQVEPTGSDLELFRNLGILKDLDLSHFAEEHYRALQQREPTDLKLRTVQLIGFLLRQHREQVQDLGRGVTDRGCARTSPRKGLKIALVGSAGILSIFVGLADLTVHGKSEMYFPNIVTGLVALSQTLA
jgi:hypothetical protein